MKALIAAAMIALAAAIRAFIVVSNAGATGPDLV